MAHSIGKTIAELRKAKGWTQLELAEKLNVSDKAVSKWESEGGFPEITQLPVLAKIFDVSIDYLMTGKETEPEIITMSKIELCAKNDDVSLAKEINSQTKDENGKTLIDYIVQYNSYKVFTAIVEKINVAKFGILKFIEFALITNNISALDKKFDVNMYCGVDNVKGLLHVDDYDNFKNLQGSSAKYACILTDKVIDIIVQDKRIKTNTIDYLLSNQKGRNCVWYRVFPYLLHQSYLHNNTELFEKVYNKAIESNNYAYDNFKREQGYNPYEYRNFFIASQYGKKEHGLVRALEKTIKLALERSDIDTVEKLNSLNNAIMKYYGQFKCYVANADEIRIAKLKMDKSISESEIKIQSTIHEGVVCIDELLNLNDFKIIKKVLNEYPIHIVELLDEWFSKSKWKELYHFAIDNNNESFASVIIAKDDKEYIRQAIQEYFKKDNYNFNKKHFYIMTTKDSLSNLKFEIGQKVKAVVSSVQSDGIAVRLPGTKKEIMVDKSELDCKAYNINDFSKKVGKEIELIVVSCNPVKLSQKATAHILKKQAVKYYRKDITTPSKSDFMAIKQRIIDELALKLDKDTTIGNLTKEYFESELSKGNIDMVVIKLCVRLEAILKCDYHYDGELSAMLEKYCQEHGWEDDGWGYSVEANHVKYLQKLRMKRNNIVHSEKNKVDLTLEELKYCIDYICKMG